jgi:hypothetical protein
VTAGAAPVSVPVNVAPMVAAEGLSRLTDRVGVDATPTDSDMLEGKSRAARRGTVGGLLRRP